MDKKENCDIEFTTYDRLLKSWENSMEMTREYSIYSKDKENDPKVREVFAEFAKDEGVHASRLRDLIIEHKNKK
ncbi:MAG: rubrerythrin [Firmicutes bacterium]|nr:rubrerythrin [Bacillota bacterium]